MSNNSQIQALKDAAQNKRAATIKRLYESLQIMQDQQIPINIESVSKFAKVSKPWIYGQPEIVEQINRLKSQNKNRFMQDQAIQIRSKDQKIEILTKQNKQLRQNIDELRLQLEIAYAAIYKQDN